jgi:rod shape-determining protein MreC
MKPFNLVALLLFLAGTVWALTRSERTVREIQRAYYSSVIPFLDAGSATETKARDFLKEVENSKKLEAKIGVIETEYTRLRLIESRYEEIEGENTRLRRALGFQERTKFTATPARVTRRNPTSWWQTVEIDKGYEGQLKTNAPVVGDGGLVGRIDRLGANQATVILLTDEACQVSVQIEGTPEVGIISGQRGQYEAGVPKLLLRFLSREAQIKPGARVFTTGRGGVFPANLLVGTIESVQAGALNTDALVRPAVDFTDLSTVFVLPPL